MNVKVRLEHKQTMTDGIVNDGPINVFCNDVLAGNVTKHAGNQQYTCSATVAWYSDKQEAIQAVVHRYCVRNNIVGTVLFQHWVERPITTKCISYRLNSLTADVYMVLSLYAGTTLVREIIADHERYPSKHVNKARKLFERRSRNQQVIL